jgi:hypothetical protein
MLDSKPCLLALLALANALPAQDTPARLTLGEFSLELRAAWERLTDTVYKFEQKYPLVRDLAPAAERATHGADRFRPFLPPGAVAVGDAWRVDAEAVLPLLRQLHAGATAELHHDGGLGLGAHGAWACLRLLDAAHAEICFRVHAEFLLAGGGKRGQSSWFTPGQFRGRMVIDRRRGEVVAFEMGVPAQSANVDINIAEGDGVSADIGRIPRLELAGGERPAFAANAASIGEREAETILARRFYPFAELDWLDLKTARAASLASGKPLHVIALFGSLTDESC